MQIVTGTGRARRERSWSGLALLLVAAMLAALAPGALASPAGAAACPCSVFPSTATPQVLADPDTSAVELGMKFRSDVDGYVTGVRFYKGTGNGGTHLGRLWNSAGSLLGSATFSNETAGGWQQVLFAAPVAVSAGQTYVVSYYAPQGRYSVDSQYFASSGVDNAPLHALANGVDGPNGVYRYGSGGGYPTNTWQSANYWVDVVLETSATDTTAPTVTQRLPAAGASGVPTSSTVSATFSEALQSGTAAVGVTSTAGAVAGTTSYDAASRTATFTPAQALAVSTGYTVTVSAARDTSGNVMAPDSWTFTTGSSTSGCPCTIWADTSTPAVASVADSSAVELGVKFRSSTAGYVTGIRFYKGSQNTGVHTGTLWSAGGQPLATVTFAGESGSGWQRASFGAPVAIQAGTTYVASYHTDAGFYAATSDGFATSGVTRGPLTALQSGVDGGNGVYRYGGGGFPTSTFRASNYWVDVVFDTTSSDATAPTVIGHVPTSGATGVPRTTGVTAIFSEAVTPASVSMQLRAGTTTVAGTTSYDAATNTAIFTPSSPLAGGASYTASVSGARDAAGNVMSGTTSWSFSTSNSSSTSPTDGPGGPVLVVTNGASTTSAFAPYTAELLRAEGLNEFATADLASVTRALLDQHDVVVLGRTPLTSAQVTLLTDWVGAGGNLIAFRPVPALAPLLGLTPTTSTLAEAYLKVGTGTAPGQGITGETMQFHGTADQWGLGTATQVAQLYSSATSATTSPAVTLRSVGTSGGQAASFTYDLPQSIVYTRQGNPAWDGQERDGFAPIRSDDLYFGGPGTRDWVDLSKVAIPQADEQQRLLANLVEHVNADRKPLPRFAYFPRGAKAVVVATGDDHAQGGTAGRFDQYLANSTSGCAVVDWQCLRFGSYVFPAAPLTAAQARSYTSQGFEVGVHPQNSCGNFTAGNLATSYSQDLASWKAKYTGIPSPTSSRFHCIVWSDWVSQAKTEANNGMRLDTNYYYWPGSWVSNRPGFMTGSGMPMRFVDKDGSVLDVYQAATQMTDESDQAYPYTPDTLLDRALGPEGYYGAFTANMHTDQATIFQDDQLIASAMARGVPIVSGKQMLDWLDGRNASAFGNIQWSGGALTFDIAVGTGANGLTAMVPTAGVGGLTLSGVNRSGSPVPFTRETVKGVEYAVFSAQPGSYTASYAAAAAATTGTSATATTLATTESTASTSRVPVISDVDVFSLPDGTASLTWTTADNADATVQFGDTPGALTERLYVGKRERRHTVVLTGLRPSDTYHFRLTSTDAAGRSATYPSSGSASFVTSAHGVADRSLAQWRMSARSSGTYLQQDDLGEVSLRPEEGQEFDRPGLPPTWVAQDEVTGGRTSVTAGAMTLDGARVLRRSATPRERALSFAATFSGAGQSAGWAGPSANQPSALIEVRDGALWAVLGTDAQRQAVRLADDLLGSRHEYRIEWTSAGAAFAVDGRPVADLRASVAVLTPRFRDALADGSVLVIDYVRVSGYASSGTYESRVLDAQEMVTWDRLSYRADVPAGTALRFSVRLGSTRVPDASWTGWTTLSGPGARVVGSSRYVQYRVEMTTSSGRRSPVLLGVAITNNGTPVPEIGETGGR